MNLDNLLVLVLKIKKIGQDCKCVNVFTIHFYLCFYVKR